MKFLLPKSFDANHPPPAPLDAASLRYDPMDDGYPTLFYLTFLCLCVVEYEMEYLVSP